MWKEPRYFVGEKVKYIDNMRYERVGVITQILYKDGLYTYEINANQVIRLLDIVCRIEE